MRLRPAQIGCLAITVGMMFTTAQASAQEESTLPTLVAEAGPTRRTLVGRPLTFDVAASVMSADAPITEVRWDFGDDTTVRGAQATHSYPKPGTYQVRLTITTDAGTSEDTTDVRVFNRMIVLIADSAAPTEQINLYSQQAADENVLLFLVTATTSSPEALVEEELTKALLAAREEITAAPIIVAWTSGSVGANVLSRLTPGVRQPSNADEKPALSDLNLGAKGIVIVSESSFALLSPTVQSMFDRLQPAYAVLVSPAALPLLFGSATADEARAAILSAPIAFRLIGAFSSRAISDLTPTNWLSFGINYLVNHGVPINNIVLVLMIPVIATILAFFRQVVGIKAFGLITPAMTTLAFLVLGLTTGLLVFIVILLSGTITRTLLRRLRLLYLPRMALVLTTASLAILVLFGITATGGQAATLTFSIFPILILIILAEEFIALQFSQGLTSALRTTAATLLLAIFCYVIVSWELFRTFLLAYPEAVLAALPLNIALGRFSGLRLTEYLRFRTLLRSNSSSN